jgi:hypothetical protein
VQLDIFKKALSIADEEILAQCSLEQNQDQDSCDQLKPTNSATLLTSPPGSKDDNQTTSPSCSSDDNKDGNQTTSPSCSSDDSVDQYIWSLKESYTTHSDEYLDETTEAELIRHLNVLKDNPQTKENIKKMRQIASK